MRSIRRSSHASTQNMAAHELIREIDRRHGFLRLGRRPPAAMPRPGQPGHWRPMTRRAKQILGQLRKTKVWRLQKQLVRELQKELENGRRQIDKLRERARKQARRAKRAGRRVKRAGQSTGRAAGRGWQRAKPRLAGAGRSARDTSRRWQEPMLKRAERKHAARQQAGQPQPRPARNPRPARGPIPHYRRPVRAPRPRRARVPRIPARTR
jgi:hypothetical protein